MEIAVGKVAFGQSGRSGRIIKIDDDGVTLDCQGQIVLVMVSSIVRTEDFLQGEPLQIWCPETRRWRSGFSYVSPHSSGKRHWISDRNGIEHTSPCEMTRRQP